MAVNYLQNRKGAKQVTFRAIANSTVQPTDLQYPDANNEIVTGFTISKLFWSTQGNITIARGANTLLTLTGNGYLPIDVFQVVLTEFPTANLVITFSDTSSSLLGELHKVFFVASTYYGS